MSTKLIPMSEYVGAPDRLKIQELLTREGTTHPRILVDAATGQEVVQPHLSLNTDRESQR